MDCYPIGAIVVSDGNILTRGRNRIYEKITRRDHIRGDELAHAEVEALLHLDLSSVDPHSCILFTTTEPCPMCMGTIYMSGVRTLHFASRDPWAGSTNLLGKTWYLSKKPIKVFPPENQLLELIIMAMFIEQIYQNHQGDLPSFAEPVFQRWMDAVPECVPFGKALYEAGTLWEARRDGINTANMLDSVVERAQS